MNGWLSDHILKGFAQKIVDEGFKQDALLKIASAYIKAGQDEQVSQLAQASNSADIWIQLADFYRLAEKSKQADEMLSQALKIAKSFPETNAQFLAEIAVGYAKNGEYNQVLNIAQSVASSEDDYAKKKDITMK